LILDGDDGLFDVRGKFIQTNQSAVLVGVDFIKFRPMAVADVSGQGERLGGEGGGGRQTAQDVKIKYYKKQGRYQQQGDECETEDAEGDLGGVIDEGIDGLESGFEGHVLHMAENISN
jgi:hypothetical protein